MSKKNVVCMEPVSLANALPLQIKAENDKADPSPHENELPTVFADRIGKIHADDSTEDHKKEFGQYLTPVIVANFMAEMIAIPDKDSVSILDPGIGSSVLTCAVCEVLVKRYRKIRFVNVVGYEVDAVVLKQTKKALEYLKKWLAKHDVTLMYSLLTKDFVLTNANILGENHSLFNSEFDKFDIVISNPPYFKINKLDPRALAASKVVYGQPNIYALFMAISAYLLNEHGELIYITPRSFSSGQYFKAFREDFFGRITPVTLHLFGSRKDAFDRDAVLQEHVIIHGTSKRKSHDPDKYKVAISFSQGVRDIATPHKRKALLKDVVNYDSPNRVMYLPTTDEEEQVISHVNCWTGSLHKYDMEISTGKVVPFRATHLLRNEGDPSNSAPLIWMNHIRGGQVLWPLKGFRKEEFILAGDSSAFLLVPNRNYVIMRRFSAKEEQQRLNTAPLLKSQLKYDLVGLENHVNYIHKPKGELTPEEAMGLSAVLSSKYFDIYFRASNGNTEVSATEVRDMPLPKHETICEIGKLILKKGVDKVDVESILEKAK